MRAIPSVCPVCKLKFRTWTAMDLHRSKVHRKRSPGCKAATCQICNEHFETTKEAKIHLTEKHPKPANIGIPSSCSICKAKFPSISATILHRAKEKHYLVERIKTVCPKCELEFDSKNEMLRHKRDMHAIIHQYPCPKCPIVFTRGLDLRDHKKTEHPFSDKKARHYFSRTCDICGERFHLTREWEIHYREAHPHKDPDISDLTIIKNEDGTVTVTSTKNVDPTIVETNEKTAENPPLPSLQIVTRKPADEKFDYFDFKR